MMTSDATANIGKIYRKLLSGTIHHPISLGRRYGNKSFNFSARDSHRSQRIQMLVESVVSSLNTLGLLFHDEYDWTEAEISFRSALRVLQENDQRYSLDYARIISNLGGVYVYNRKVKQASEAFYKAIDIYERAGKKDSAEYGIVLANLGESKVNEGDFIAAEPMLKQALALQEGVASPDNIASAYNNLATLYQRTNRLSEAHKFLSHAMGIVAGVLPDNHQLKITINENMKSLIQSMKKERP